MSYEKGFETESFFFSVCNIRQKLKMKGEQNCAVLRFSFVVLIETATSTKHSKKQFIFFQSKILAKTQRKYMNARRIYIWYTEKA